MSRPTVCLMMIVRDEAAVIRRCLDSVRPQIDSWVIVDTGSTDGTQEIVRRHLADLPGELAERPWRHFAHNRNQALELARDRADYLLTLDADEVLELAPGFVLPPLTADSYLFRVRLSGYRYLRRSLVRSDLPWRYVGALHEYLHCDRQVEEELLPGIVTLARPEGARSRDPLKYRRDAALLERELLDDPENGRYVFYLAQSYRDADQPELALHHYRRRIALGGWPEEVGYAAYQVAVLAHRLGQPWPEVQQLFLEAHALWPRRAEPLHHLARHYQETGQWALAHLFLSRAAELPLPAGNDLFVEEEVYRFQVPIDFAASCHYAGELETAIALANRLLADPELPPRYLDLVAENRRHSLRALQPPAAPAAPVGTLRIFAEAAPDIGFAEAVESLEAQTDPLFLAFFLGDAGPAGAATQLPAGDARFGGAPDQAGRPQWSRLARALAALPASEVVLVTGQGRLADPGIVDFLRETFADPGCELLYGRSRDGEGRLSAAAPAPSAAAFAARGPLLPESCPFALRAGLAHEVLAADPEAGAATPHPWLLKLARAAGFGRTRFSERALTSRSAGPAGGAPARPGKRARGQAEPLVSCLMVTHGRVRLARRAFESFAAQTHGRKELVVVSDGPLHVRLALLEHAARLGLGNLRLITPEGPRRTLGALRNLAMEKARGEILCQWDDDDWSHPERLARQLDLLRGEGAAAAFLAEHLQFFEDSRELAWLDWRRAAAGSRLHPGTLMLRRDASLRYPEEGPESRRGEDTALLGKLAASRPIAILADEPWLYLYTYHGANTFGRDHHQRLTPMMTDADRVLRHEERLRETITRLDLPKPVRILGPAGEILLVVA